MRILVMVILIAFLTGALLSGCVGKEKTEAQVITSDVNKSGVFFNQKFIDGLYSNLSLDDPDEVFKKVFSALDNEVIVYPTENYYYFTLYTNGKTIWGNLRLDASSRDNGTIHIGYFEYDESGTYQDREGRSKAFSEKDGVVVKRIEPFMYLVSYSGKSVTFRLNDIGMEKPGKALLRESEIFVGPIFDESGLKFFLIFNNEEKHFMYVLNEDGYVSEDFITLDENIVTGRRTGMVFFEDIDNNRKVLIGVNGKNTDRNSWYDGPFDQLPDNYVEQTNISKYIEEAYPVLKGSINKFGTYTTQEGRVIIFPYTVFYKEDDVINIVKSCNSSELSEDEFYACITPDPFKQYSE